MRVRTRERTHTAEQDAPTRRRRTRGDRPSDEGPGDRQQRDGDQDASKKGDQGRGDEAPDGQEGQKPGSGKGGSGKRGGKGQGSRGQGAKGPAKGKGQGQGQGQGGKGQGGKGRSRSQRSRRGRNQRKQRPDGPKFWGDVERLPEVRTDVRITNDPTAVPRSLGPPPLKGHESIAEHYFGVVYDRAVTTAGALAAAGGLIDADALESELGD
jgi:hypothetical protein